MSHIPSETPKSKAHLVIQRDLENIATRWVPDFSFLFCCSIACRGIEGSVQLFPGKTSLDLIFGRPKQTSREWSTELEQVHFCLLKILTLAYKCFEQEFLAKSVSLFLLGADSVWRPHISVSTNTWKRHTAFQTSAQQTDGKWLLFGQQKKIGRKAWMWRECCIQLGVEPRCLCDHLCAFCCCGYWR